MMSESMIELKLHILMNDRKTEEVGRDDFFQDTLSLAVQSWSRNVEENYLKLRIHVNS